MVLTALPVDRWSRLLSTGTLCIEGVLREVVVLGEHRLEGPVRLEVVFVGGEAIAVQHMRLARGPAAVEEALDPVLSLRPVVEELWDPVVEATGVPAEGVALTLASDLRLALEQGVHVTLSAATRGPPHSPSLVRPLVVGFGGEGVRLEHDGYKRLSRFAAIRLHRASLHPDGRVCLEGRGPTLLDAAVRRGLQTASGRVTKLVREGKRLRSLRPYLTL